VEGFDLITGVPWNAIGVVGLVAIIGMSFIKGWIYPKGYVDTLREDRDARILEVRKDREDRVREYQQEVSFWREAAQQGDIALAAERAKVTELLEVARTMEKLLNALPKVGEDA